MGTATFTRSQSRKTRSTFSSEASDRGLSSPFGNFSGNHQDSSSRRSSRRPTNASNFIEKENAPPSSNGQSNQNSEREGMIESKDIKKRKQSTCKGIDSGSKMRKIPVTVGHENLSKASQDLQITENVPRAETCSDRPSVQQPSAGILSPVPNDCNIARKAKVVDSNEAPTKQTGNYQNSSVVSPGMSALAVLQKDYDRLFAKYKKLKAQRLEEVEDLYKEQNSRITEFVHATQALIDFYKTENDSLRQQIQGANIPELLNRCKGLEKANLECRNDLLQEQSNGLELKQENKRLKSLLLEHIADKHKQSDLPVPVPFSQTHVPPRESNSSALSENSKLVQRLLECVLGLQLSNSGNGAEAHLHFEHGPTGFSFDLKEAHDVEIADLVGGGELMYQNVSLGACKRAVDWMKEKEMIFGMDQVQLLLKKLIGFLNRGFYG